jgi:hypothetical protein
MGILTVCPSHYEGLAFAGAYLVLISALPILYSFYNKPSELGFSSIPAELSWLQTCSFILFLSSLECVSTMLPCGRYYYDIEGGYVGNPFVKASYQYIVFYLGWFVHHLDRIESAVYGNSRTYICSEITINGYQKPKKRT